MSQWAGTLPTPTNPDAKIDKMMPMKYVIGRDVWSLKEDGYALSEAMQRQFNIDAPVVTTPPPLENHLLHYVNRYEYLDNADEGNHPSNRVILTWYHGAPDHPDFSRMYARLLSRLDEIDHIVTSCQSTVNHLITAGVPAPKITVIPIGIDLERFRQPIKRGRAALGIPLDAVCIGSFQQDGIGGEDGDQPKLIKGPDVLLEVIARLFEREPRLFVLLTGPKRGYVKNGLQKIGVPFVHHHFDAHTDTADCFHAADLILITSREEGGPKALLEAWAAGVPLVSTRMGMPADFVQHGENGLLAAVEDVNGLTTAAQRVIEQPAFRAQMAAAGLETVKAFTWDRVAEMHYQRVYKPLDPSPKSRLTP